MMDDYNIELDFVVREKLWDGIRDKILGFCFPKETPLLVKHNSDAPGWVYATFCTNHPYDVVKVIVDFLPTDPYDGSVLEFTGLD